MSGSVIQWPVVPKPQPNPPKNLRLVNTDDDLRDGITCLDAVMMIRRGAMLLRHRHNQSNADVRVVLLELVDEFKG